MKTMTLTLRVLAHLLSYPIAGLREHLPQMREALHAEGALAAGRLAELDALIARLHGDPALDTESAYVELFDRGRGTALHLFEHVHGDSRDRGPAMVDLVKTYEQAGLFMSPDELPDHLTVVLEYASTQPPAQAREFLSEISHIVRVIFTALNKRDSAYASVVAAVLELAGEKVAAVKLPAAGAPAPVAPAEAEPDLDESWEEPLAFGGCSTEGQARPGQPQPIQIIKQRPTAGGAVSSQPGVRP